MIYLRSALSHNVLYVARPIIVWRGHFRRRNDRGTRHNVAKFKKSDEAPIVSKSGHFERRPRAFMPASEPVLEQGVEVRNDPMCATVFADPLSRLRIAGCEYVSDIASGKDVFHVNSPHALTQAAGYLKYINGKKRYKIFIEGQSKLYKNLPPSLVRGLKGQKAQSNRITALRNACSEITKSKIFNGIPFEAHEPLLQHYGLKTS